MPSIKPLNIWGRAANSIDGVPVSSLEAQRNDLWVLRLDSVLNYIDGIATLRISNDDPERDGEMLSEAIGPDFGDLATRYNSMLPPTDRAVYYASSVEFPEQRTASQVIVKETRPYQMPGADEPLGPVRITFLHDVTKGQYSGSSLDAVLRMWRGLVRTGRGGMSGQDFVLPLGSFNDGLLPRYSFDLRVDLFKGSADGEGMDYSAGYLLKSAWLQSIQVGALRYAGGTQNLEISTTMAVADITPVTSS